MIALCSALDVTLGLKEWAVVHADCRELLAALPEASVDAVVTDPPYGLGFMGMAWDTLDGRESGTQRRERGKHFDHIGGNHNPTSPQDAARTRRVENQRAQTFHEAWAAQVFRVLKPGGHLLAFGGTRTYHRIACAIEDAGFEVRDCLAWMYGTGFPKSLDVSKAIDKVAGAEREVVGVRPSYRPAANAARDPQGFQDRSDGLLTKPATEDARRWQGWGTALKPAFEPIILARKPLSEGTVAANVLAHGTGAINIDGCRIGSTIEPPGRWPANVALDEAAAAMLDEQTGTLGASRFFYTAKASTRERNAGLPDGKKNDHPTVKPIALMRWLVRLVTPPGGIVLDPFAGSGTTGIAARAEGFAFLGVERDSEGKGYVELARARIRGAEQEAA